MKESFRSFRFSAATFSFLAGCLVCGSPPNVRANSIVNGEFATGDLTGWIASAIDSLGNPIAPLIEVRNLGGENSAVFSTGEFDTGPFISTLQQTFTVAATEPVLSFNFSLPEVMVDPTGAGQSPFLDTLIVSVQDGLSRELLLVIKSGAVPDPFGTAPGSIGLGPSTSPLLQYNLQADLSTLAGSEVTLFIDVINEDDGFASVFDSTYFSTEATTSKTPDLTPTLLLFLTALSAVILFDLQQSRRTIR